MKPQSEVLKISEEIIGSRISDIQRTKSGVSSVVYELTLENGNKYYFKQGDKNYLIQKELTAKLNELGVPVPEIVSVTNEYLLLKGVDAFPLSDITDRGKKLKALGQFGRYLALFNSIPAQKFGQIESPYVGRNSSYKEFYFEVLPYVKPKFKTMVDDYLERVGNIDMNLVHGDVGESHIYVDRDGNFKYLIDTDDIYAAPYYYDVAELVIGSGNDREYFEALMSGYSTVMPKVEYGSKDLLIEQLLIETDSLRFWLGNEDKRQTARRQSDIKENEKFIGIIEDSLAKYL